MKHTYPPPISSFSTYAAPIRQLGVTYQNESGKFMVVQFVAVKTVAVAGSQVNAYGYVSATPTFGTHQAYTGCHLIGATGTFIDVMCLFVPADWYYKVEGVYTEPNAYLQFMWSEVI